MNDDMTYGQPPGLERRPFRLGAAIGAAICSATAGLRLVLCGGGILDLTLSALVDSLAGSHGDLPSRAYLAALLLTYEFAGAALAGCAALCGRSRRSVLLIATCVAILAAAAQFLFNHRVVFG